jgi:hypothetical protein
MGMVMLSNMYNYGAEKCANEIYHTWFTDGSIWDNSLTSPNVPAPGYVPGGPNKSYSGSVAGITNQPAQKAYKDWNAGFPEKFIGNNRAFNLLPGVLCNVAGKINDTNCYVRRH